MVLNRNLLYILIMIVTLLTACSFTSNELTSGNVDGTFQNDVEKEEVTIGEEDEVIRLYEQNVTYVVEGQEHSETGFLNSSTNQLFSIYVFKDFQLEVEAPNKDVLLHKANKNILMRIELMPENLNYFQLEYDTYKQLNMVSNDVHREVWREPDPLLKGAVMLYAKNNNESVQIILIKDRAHYPNMKLTIYSQEEDEVVERLLAMARTIVKTSMNR